MESFGLQGRPSLALSDGALWPTRERHITCRTEQGAQVLAIGTAQLFEDVLAGGFSQELLAYAAQTPPRDVVLDMQEVKAVCSEAIDAITDLCHFLHRHGRRLVLSGVCPAVEEAFHVARLARAEPTLNDLLPMQSDLPSALGWLAASAPMPGSGVRSTGGEVTAVDGRAS